MKPATFFHTFSTQMSGKRGFTRNTGESEYPRQYSKLNFFDVFTLVKSGRRWAALGT